VKSLRLAAKLLILAPLVERIFGLRSPPGIATTEIGASFGGFSPIDERHCVAHLLGRQLMPARPDLTSRLISRFTISCRS
jgi:hypothetical protein